MADLYQSSLFEPTAPREDMLHKHVQAKPLQTVTGQGCNGKVKTPVTSTPSRPGHTLAPFLDYFTKRRKNNNNNNNNNNDSKFNHEHSSKPTETRGDGSRSKAENGGKLFNFFRGKQTSDPSLIKDSTKTATASEKDETTLSQNPEVDSSQPESMKLQTKDEMEVVCHGLVANTESFGQNCLLTGSGHETSSDSELGVQKNANQKPSALLDAIGKNSEQTQSDENEVPLKYEKFVDTSGMQEQLNSINLKRSKDATMPQSICSMTTLPAHSESLSIPPVIEEIEESSVEEPPVIEVFLPQREPSVKQSSGIELMQGLDGNLGTHNNVKKRRKLRHVLRHFLGLNNSFAKEDKQRLVENEEEDDEEEEQTMVETAIDEQESQGNNKCPISNTPPTPDNKDTLASEKKRQPGSKGRGWGRRVRRSLGRGCHYLGLSVLNVTNYIIAEATFMGPMYSSRNYDWEYIYNTNEYGVSYDYA